MLNIEPHVIGLREYIDSVEKAENEINRRKNALQAYLEERKLAHDEIDLATDPAAVF